MTEQTAALRKFQHIERDGYHYVMPDSGPCETFGKGETYEAALESLTKNVAMMTDQWEQLKTSLSQGADVGFTLTHIKVEVAGDYLCDDCDEITTGVELDNNDDRCIHCGSSYLSLIED